MKLITVPMFQHSLLSPKGFKFDITKMHIIKTIFGAKNSLEFRENNTLIKWIETQNDTYSDLGEEFFNKYLDSYIVEIDNTNHYTWLDNNLEEFWQNVFGKSLDETSCAGIVSAHGDKCYQYRDQWLEAGIPFFYGVAIYLLTYTEELGDTPKHESCQWVIDNYNRYVKLLPCISTRDYVQPSDLAIVLKDEMWVTLNQLMIKKYMETGKAKQLLSILGDNKLQLTKRRPNSSRVVDDQVMVKGVGIFNKKYFVEIEA